VSALERLRHLGFVLPEDVGAAGQYVPAVLYGNLVHVSGQLPRQGGQVVHVGRVGAEISMEAARDAAQIAALRFLAAAAAVAGSIDALAQVLELRVYVRSAPGFADQTLVADAASELISTVVGGGHARAAVGVAELPRGAPVEIAGIVAVRQP
jgi:enamine deaminase RidA (YjgF/YER057c/UK114 family)